MPSRLVGFVFIAIAFGSVSFAQTTVAKIPDPPITGSERLRWLAGENVSPASLLSDVG